MALLFARIVALRAGSCEMAARSRHLDAFDAAPAHAPRPCRQICPRQWDGASATEPAVAVSEAGVLRAGNVRALHCSCRSSQAEADGLVPNCCPALQRLVVLWDSWLGGRRSLSCKVKGCDRQIVCGEAKLRRPRLALR